MIKKTLFTIFFLLLFMVNSYSAESGDGGSTESGASKIRTDYDKAVSHIKLAKKYEKKPNNPNTLNYLGFTTRKLGDFVHGEKFYLEGLAIEPNHIGINEYLGELYVATNRIDLAKERLKILKSCNCEEYIELSEIIKGTKKSKY